MCTNFFELRNFSEAYIDIILKSVNECLSKWSIFEE